MKMNKRHLIKALTAFAVTNGIASATFAQEVTLRLPSSCPLRPPSPAR